MRGFPFQVTNTRRGCSPRSTPGRQGSVLPLAQALPAHSLPVWNAAHRARKSSKDVIDVILVPCRKETPREDLVPKLGRFLSIARGRSPSSIRSQGGPLRIRGAPLQTVRCRRPGGLLPEQWQLRLLLRPVPAWCGCGLRSAGPDRLRELPAGDARLRQAAGGPGSFSGDLGGSPRGDLGASGPRCAFVRPLKRPPDRTPAQANGLDRVDAARVAAP
jgi:hypothetical protein